MASGSSGRNTAASKGFDFGSDDVICSIDDFSGQESSSGKRMDPTIGSISGMDNRDSRTGRSLSNVYGKPEDSFSQEIPAIVEKTMKKYADNVLRYLEGMSGRLSQLELYCYNIEQSIGDLRSDLTRDHSEADLKLRSLEKHLKEIHRSVQILRDRQELSDTQKELEKLQLAKEATASMSHSQQKDDGAASSTSEMKKPDNSQDVQSHQLALALPHQITLPASVSARAMEPQHSSYQELQSGLTSLPFQQASHPPQPALASLPQSQNVPVQQPPQQALQTQVPQGIYHSQQMQMPSLPPPTQQHPQDQHLQTDLQYAQQRPQLQELPRQAPQPQPHASQAQTHSFPSYPPHWPQQFPQESQPQVRPPPPASHAQMKPQTSVYPSYQHQPANPSSETYVGSMPTQTPFSGVPSSVVGRSDTMAFGYGGPGRTGQPHSALVNMLPRQPPLQSNQGTYGSNIGDGAYPGAAPRPALPPPVHGYGMYDADGRQSALASHIQPVNYPVMHASAVQNQQPGGGIVARHPNQQMTRNHPYNEMIEKAVGMGYPRDQVASVIQRMDESGQPVDFNSLLDRLNARF